MSTWIHENAGALGTTFPQKYILCCGYYEYHGCGNDNANDNASEDNADDVNGDP